MARIPTSVRFEIHFQCAQLLGLKSMTNNIKTVGFDNYSCGNVETLKITLQKRVSLSQSAPRMIVENVEYASLSTLQNAQCQSRSIKTIDNCVISECKVVPSARKILKASL